MTAVNPIPTVDGIPPQALEMEQAVLGAMLIESSIIPAIAAGLPADAFYREAHQAIYRAILRTHDRGIPVDVLTVQNALLEKRQLEQCGGSCYLVGLTNAVPAVANADYYAAQVVRCAALRSAVALGERVQRLGYEGDVDGLLRQLQQLGSFDAGLLGGSLGADPLEAGLVCAENVPAGQKPDRLWFGLYRAAVVLFVGETGAGKSSLLYSIAVHAARNEPLFGIPFGKGRPLRVLYVDPENAGCWDEGQGGVCGQRLDRLGAGRPPTLWFHNGQGMDLSSSSHARRLGRLVKAKQIDLLILDPIANLFSTVDENSNAEAAKQMRTLIELSRETGCCVVACHHTGKDTLGHSGGYGRAASARLAAADVGLALRAKGPREDDGEAGQAGEGEDAPDGTLAERSDVCRLSIAKNRLEGKGSLYLRMAGQDRFERASVREWRGGASVGGEADRSRRVQNLVLGLLNDSAWHARADIVDELRGHEVGRGTADQALADLRQRGFVEVQRLAKGRMEYRLAPGVRPEGMPLVHRMWLREDDTLFTGDDQGPFDLDDPFA